MKIPPDEISSRLRKLRALINAGGISAAFITGESEVQYFSGFTGSDSALLICGRKKWLLTDSRYTEEAEKSTKGWEIVLWKRSIAGYAAELLKSCNVKKCGAQHNIMCVTAHKCLEKAGIRTAPLDTIISRIRARKSGWEVGRIKKSLKIAEKSFKKLLEKICLDMTESDIRTELEYIMQKEGAEKPSFDTIVACGANSSLPHAHAGKRKLREEIPLLIDFGVYKGGYTSDLTRTLFIGNIAEIWKNRYEQVLEAQQAGINAIKSGISCAEVDKSARNVFETAGCLSYFSHSLGHGLGMQVHEAPRLSVKSQEKLIAGNVVTVEPGLYYPGKGGIRIEDMVLVTDSGAEILSSLGKSLEAAVI